MIPPEAESTKLLKHISSALPLIVSVVNTPLPAGIAAPVNEKPKVVGPAVTIKPFAAAAPPAALSTVTPLTLNWKPAIATLLEYITSTSVVAHEEPSPLHSPHSSATAEPPQSPAQSRSAVQLPSQSKFSAAYSQEPSSSVASAL